jgi:hypothetical protein
MSKLRFDHDEIRHFAQRYEDPNETMIERLVSNVRAAGHLSKAQLLEVGHWKSPRIVGHLKKNSEELVRETTRIALTTPVEALRICVPQILAGVGFPMASVILHFFHKDEYPVLDFRALWSLGMQEPKDYSTQFWMHYVEICRAKAAEANVDMRTLDRALWQYSIEHQPKSSP